MQYKSVKGFTGLGQLGFLFAFFGLGVILASTAELFLGLQILPAGAKITNNDMFMNALLSPEHVNMNRVIQLIASLLLLFLPAFLWSFVSNGKKMFWLGFNKYINWQQLALGFLIIFTAGFAAGPLEDFTRHFTGHFPAFDAAAKKMEDEYNMQALALSHLRGWGDYLIGLLIMAFFPAMFEEVFFRGAVQNLLVKWLRKPLAGITITSIFFSLIHLSVYLFLSRFVLGFALGLMFYETKNIWVNILAHFLNNAIALSMLFATKNPEAKDMADPDVPWFVGVISVIVLAGLIIFLKRFSVSNKAKIDAKENLLIASADPFRSFTETNPDGHQ